MTFKQKKQRKNDFKMPNHKCYNTETETGAIRWRKVAVDEYGSSHVEKPCTRSVPTYCLEPVMSAVNLFEQVRAWSPLQAPSLLTELDLKQAVPTKNNTTRP